MKPETIPGKLDLEESRFACLVPILLAAIVVRIALITTSCLRADISLSQFALLHDGWEYVRMSRAFAQFHPGDIPLANFRLFPGYPVAIALLSFGKYFAAAGLAISVVGAGVCAAATARLGGRRDLGWWMVALTPSWLLYTSVVMSESLSTLMILAGLIMTCRGRWAAAGLLAGLGVVVRPVGAFLFVPILVEAALRRDRRGALTALGAGVPWPLLYLLMSWLVWKDPLKSLRDYSGTVEAYWPLESLIRNTFNPGISIFKKGIVWGTLLVAVVGVAGLWRGWREGEDRFRPIFWWQVSAGLFYLATPGVWVFGSTDRYFAALWPTALIGLVAWAPRKPGILAAICVVLSAISFFVALRWVVNLAAVFPFDARAF